MIIKHISIRNFGSIHSYDTTLNSNLNILDTYFTTEISKVIELLLYSRSLRNFKDAGVNSETLISAEVLLNENLYFVELNPGNKNPNTLEITVRDVNGSDKTDFYLNTLSHCTEQDYIENFDGRDSSLPLRLCWYKGCDDLNVPSDLSRRTNFIVGTKTFRSHLIRYIKAFEPESISNKKEYKASLDKQGKFNVISSDTSEKIKLSETEEKLFWYICFLNIAEFWNDIEKIRDFHHEKKPVLIKNFLEFLDHSANINGLIVRTAQLKRQAIILTPPMQEAAKNKWLGKKPL